ncbi:MAG: NAD(P)H-dependent oxidoreductase [Bacillaceae bacterium]|nr:NAD(P)H-dependent oxidoreductase [Bacillaceae bacterium]
MRILVIARSPKKESNTRGLSQVVSEQLRFLEAEVLYFDVGHHTLPLFSGDGEDKDLNVQLLRDYAYQADGFFICTPEYHNGISGGLKNALDFLNKDYFREKPVMMAAVSGGGKGGINALNNLRIVVRGLLGMVLSEQYVADQSLFQNNQLMSSEAIERLKILSRRLVDVTNALSKRGNMV